MSASKDKLIRKQQIEAGTDKRSKALAEEEKQRRRTKITYSVVAVCLVIFFAFIFIYNSSWPARHTTAVTIDGEDYSVAQMNYYYSNSYMTFYSNYSSYISYGMFFDTRQSLADQEYSEGYSWRDYFMDDALASMSQIKMLNDQAEAAGFTLSEEQQASYDEQLAAMDTNWEALGYSNLQQYLNMNFGKGVTRDIVAQELYRTFVATAYAQSLTDGYEFTDEELDGYYAEHADELDVIDYMYYLVSDTESVDAQAIADAINGTGADDFTDYMAANYEGSEPTRQSLAGSSLSTVYADWLLDSARQSGDATAIENGDSSYVVMFLDRDTNDYPTVGFRHILVMAQDTDGDGVYSQEEKDAAEAMANDIYEEWQAGEATEDSFAALVPVYSDDTGSVENGGLYENVYKNYMVEPINDWVFEEGRQAGDTTVVSYDGSDVGGYVGTHVVYFTGADDMTYARSQADTLLRNESYNAWVDEHMTDYEPVTSHLKMVGKHI